MLPLFWEALSDCRAPSLQDSSNEGVTRVSTVWEGEWDGRLLGRSSPWRKPQRTTLRRPWGEHRSPLGPQGQRCCSGSCTCPLAHALTTAPWTQFELPRGSQASLPRAHQASGSPWLSPHSLCSAPLHLLFPLLTTLSPALWCIPSHPVLSLKVTFSERPVPAQPPVPV